LGDVVRAAPLPKTTLRTLDQEIHTRFITVGVSEGSFATTLHVEPATFLGDVVHDVNAQI
jgi:hypothetical protein